MTRREVITLLGGAAVAWPLAARAQHSGHMRRIVFLHSLAENDPEVQTRIAAFRQGLHCRQQHASPCGTETGDPHHPNCLLCGQ